MLVLQPCHSLPPFPPKPVLTCLPSQTYCGLSDDAMDEVANSLETMPRLRSLKLVRPGGRDGRRRDQVSRD